MACTSGVHMNTSTTKESPKISAPETLPGDTSAITQMSKAEIEITNRRYQSDPFWGGPKGIEYGLLVGALPIQQPPLYPDRGSSYFVGNFRLPKGSKLMIQGEYGHMRYFSFTVAVQLGQGQIGGGDFIRDNEIDPDPGSVNPFRPGHERDATPRSYTVYVHQGQRPEAERTAKPGERRAKHNTLYTGSDSYEARIHLALRNYISDAGYDGTGNVELHAQGYGLPKVTLILADGTTLTGEKMAELVQASKAAEVAGYTREQWLGLVENSWDPINAPAVSAPAFQRFWNVDYNVTGGFITDPVERVLLHPPNDSGGFANNPDTVYLAAPFSLAFGEVVVIRAKMPSFPKTRHREPTLAHDTQVRYWSLTTGAAAPSGVGWTSVFDEQVPVDEKGYFTIVMSWPENRPKNAIRACGVKWIDFGGGEGHYVGARAWVNIVYLRYMHSLSGEAWPQSPANIPQPTKDKPAPLDAVVMEDYYPRARYTSKANFEKFGPQMPELP